MEATPVFGMLGVWEKLAHFQKLLVHLTVCDFTQNSTKSMTGISQAS